MDTIKAFFAINLTPSLQSQLAAKMAIWQQQYPELRWSLPEHLHLTLVYLRKLDLLVVNELITTIESELFTKFELQLGELELFPSNRRPHVLSLQVGLNEELDALVRCLEKLAEQVLKMKIGENRPFRPHITLARIPTPKQQYRELTKFPCSFEKSLAVNEFILYESRPTKAGSNYLILRRFSIAERR